MQTALAVLGQAGRQRELCSWRQAQVSLVNECQVMKFREDRRGFYGNIFRKQWNTERSNSVSSRSFKYFYLSDLAWSESLNDESQPNKLTDSVSKWLSKNWRASKSFKNKYINHAHTCWYTWIFNIFHFSPVNMLLKKNLMPEPFVLEKELHEYSQINSHFEPSDLSMDSTKLLGEGHHNSFQSLLAFQKWT